MRIYAKTVNFVLTDAIRRHVEVRTEAALDPVARRVVRVNAHLKDVNSVRGGIDKHCRLVASLSRHGVIVAEALDADLYAAVSIAAMRLRRLALQAVRWRVKRERKDRQRPGALLSA